MARGYVDDAAFARHWVETRSVRGIGPVRLRPELRTHGVAASLIDAVLATLGADDQLAQARAAAERRLSALRQSAPERAAARLREHLLRRGFPGAVVARVVRDCLGVRLDD